MKLNLLFFLFFIISKLTFSQVNLNDGLVAYYPFNGNANELTGNGLNGSLQNGVLFTTDRFGASNSACSFDGIDDFIQIPHNTSVTPGSTSSICLFFNTATTTVQTILGKIGYFSGTGTQYQIAINFPPFPGVLYGTNPTTNNCAGVPLNGNYINSGGAVATNQWQCVVTTFDNGTLKLYLNGVLIQTTTSAFTTPNNCTNADVQIGSWWNGDTQRFNGKIDDVRFYNRAINAMEVAAIYNLTTSDISTVINQYTPAISLNICNNQLLVKDATQYNIGDTVLLIQMKGAIIDSSNTQNFGTITNYNNAGNYEFNYVQSKIGNNIKLKNGLTKSYDFTKGKVQLIRVPYYNSLKVNNTLTCSPWNGEIGGVLVFNVKDTLTLQADIDVSGKGFRGGIDPYSNPSSFNCNEINYFYPPNPDFASGKGEGIADISISKSFGKGLIANGGGGGNSHNSGGGGGSNAGQGGFGGFQFEGSPCNGGSIPDIRGIGGKSLVFNNTANNIFMGGGGGAGHSNNPEQFNALGGFGGGIVIISSNYIKSNNFKISSNGANGLACGVTGSGCHEGMGGGGAGGNALLNINNYIDNTFIETKGGNGANMESANNQRVGPGGGGGAGVLWLKQSSTPVNVNFNINAGINGVCTSYSNDAWGATPGQAGQTLFNLILPIDNTVFKPNIDSVRFTNNNTSCSNINFNGFGFTKTSPIVSWAWAFGDGATANTQNTAHNYTTTGTFNVTLIATDFNGCIDSIVKQISTNGLLVDAGMDTTFCANTKTTILTATSNQLNVSYSWSPTANLSNNNTATPTANIDTTTTFYVSITNSIGCSSVDSIKINLNKIPTVKTLKDTSICRGTTLVLTTTPGLSSYQWSNGIYVSDSTINSPNFIDTVTRTLYITGTQNGCQGRDTLNIIVKPLPNTTSIPDTITCSTKTIILTTTGADTYAWFPPTNLSDPNTASPTFIGNSGNNYLVTGTNTSTGCKNVDTVNIKVNIPNSFVQPPNKMFCNKDSIMLDGFNGNNAQYSWSGPKLSNPNIINPIASPTVTTNYNVAIYDRYCDVTQNFTVPVNVLPLPNVASQKSNDVSCLIPSSNLIATGAAKYSWSPIQTLSNSNIANPIATPTTTTTYVVKGTDKNNCSKLDSIVVFKNNSDGILFLPNAFTPNKDGKNDCFGVKVNGQIANFNLQVYNRWGEKVFETTNSNQCWDGTQKGQLAEAANYVYFVKAKTLCGEIFSKGNVILIR